MAVYTSHVRGRVRAMYTAEDVRADGPYTVMYTGGVDGPCARPIHGRVRTVYTARPLYGRVRAVFAGEDVFTCARNGHTTRYTAVYTARTRPHNGRLHVCVHGRVIAVYTSRARRIHGGVMSVYTCHLLTGRVHGRGRAVYTSAYMALTLHGPYTAIIPRQDNTRFMPFICIIFHL